MLAIYIIVMLIITSKKDSIKPSKAVRILLGFLFFAMDIIAILIIILLFFVKALW